ADQDLAPPGPAEAGDDPRALCQRAGRRRAAVTINQCRSATTHDGRSAQENTSAIMSDPTENLTNPAGHADVEMFDFYVAQLEAYLDGELDAEEAAQVRRRLMQEEAYAAALGRLHAQRVQRMEVFRQI